MLICSGPLANTEASTEDAAVHYRACCCSEPGKSRWHMLQERWPRHVILRSSIMYGPQSAVPVSRTLFLQFVSSALSQGEQAQQPPVFCRCWECMLKSGYHSTVDRPVLCGTGPSSIALCTVPAALHASPHILPQCRILCAQNSTGSFQCQPEALMLSQRTVSPLCCRQVCHLFQ